MLTDMCAEELESILNFIYNGEVSFFVLSFVVIQLKRF